MLNLNVRLRGVGLELSEPPPGSEALFIGSVRVTTLWDMCGGVAHLLV